MVEINSANCVNCNLCFRACPYGIIEPGPEIPASRKAFCVKCGHCYAICPQDAITIDGVSGEAAPRSECGVGADAMKTLLLNRRSGRFFLPVPVSMEDMEFLAAAAASGPSSTNSRLAKAYVIRTSALIDDVRKAAGMYFATLRKMFTLPGASFLAKLQGVNKDQLERVMPAILHITNPPDGKDPLFYNSKTLMVFTVPVGSSDDVIGEAWIAAQNVVIAAESIPVSTCYNGFLTFTCQEYPYLKTLMGIPKNEKVVAALMMGYPSEKFVRNPKRAPMEIVWK